MIRFEKVSKFLGGKWVLDEVSFEIPRGETCVIVGLSGAGKSVTLKHMVRLLQADKGKVIIDGTCVNELSRSALQKLRSKFGVLFQSAALMQWMNVFENVALPLKEHTSMQKDEIRREVIEKLDMVGLSEAIEKFPSDLSGGMRKRVGLARALIMKPEIVVYDEPTSGLDPVTSRKIDRLIMEMREQLGLTSVVVTHDLHSALTIGSRILMLHHGKIVESSAPSEFIQSKNEIVQQFLASQYITRRGRWETEFTHG